MEIVTDDTISAAPCTRCEKPHEESTKLCARCKAGQRAANAKYSADHPEKVRAYHAKYRIENLEKCRARYASWQKENPEKCRAANAKYRIENPELLRAANAKYRINNAEKVRACCAKYRTDHPEKERARGAARRSRKLQAMPQWVDQAAIKAIYASAPDGHHIDHIIPLAHPDVCGLHVPWNLRAITATENMCKNNKFDGTWENDGWRKYMYNDLEDLYREYVFGLRDCTEHKRNMIEDDQCFIEWVEEFHPDRLDEVIQQPRTRGTYK